MNEQLICPKCGKEYSILEDTTYCPTCDSLESIEVLKSQDFFEVVCKEFDKKIVGEEATRKVIFLCAAGGRLVMNCQIASFNLLVNDEAGVGKDYVAAAVLDMLPTDVYIHKTRISPTVFTYWHNAKFEPEWTWDGKVFYPEDISEIVLNSDVFKVMCSKGSSATMVIKQVAYEIDIKGKPVMITTTASATPNPELTRRFVILNLDSSEDQTKAIMKRHSQFKKRGVVPDYNPIFKEALGKLKRVRVKIPFADLIDAHFPAKSVIMRTHYPRFLDYVCAAASLHQYQRKTDEEGFILADPQDYEIARECFQKLCSNKYMIPLTINQKKILEVLEKEPELRDSASHLHTKKMGFLSLPALQTNLGILTKYGILETDTEMDSMNREIEVFMLSRTYNPNEKFEIPTYQQISENSLVSLQSLIALPTLTSLPSQQTEGDTKDTKDVKVPKGIENIHNKCSKCGSDQDLIRICNRDEYVEGHPDIWICDNCRKEMEMV